MDHNHAGKILTMTTVLTNNWCWIDLKIIDLSLSTLPNYISIIQFDWNLSIFIPPLIMLKMPNKRSHYGEFEFGSNSSIQVFGYKQIRLSFWYC